MASLVNLSTMVKHIVFVLGQDVGKGPTKFIGMSWKGSFGMGKVEVGLPLLIRTLDLLTCLASLGFTSLKHW